MKSKENDISYPLLTTMTKSTSQLDAIPYASVFVPVRELYIPDMPIEAKIINFDEERRGIFLMNIYHIELRHGNFSWIIKRRYNHFWQLHRQIWLFYTGLTLPLPTHNSRENRKVLAKIGNIEFPKFPKPTDAFFVHETVSVRMKRLEEYLRFLLSNPLFRQHKAVVTFLQISPYSFIKELGYKGEEFLIKKRAGGFRSPAFCTRVENFFTSITGHWRDRWLVVKDTCLFYVRPMDNKIRYVMLFDRDFRADSGITTIGITYGVRIRNMSRQLMLKGSSKKEAKDLADYLNEYAKLHGKQFVTPNRYDSFSPVRKGTYCQWFVDGAAHFEAVSQAIEMAEEEIYIADWWLSPEIYLKRPSLGYQWRLDHLLLKKARQGVRIFILLFKEVEIGLSINSIYTKRTLMKMHPKISVLRHPDPARGGPLWWSHHEKLVIIDQKYAFVGGIDLCFGRWDNYEHRLTDLGGITFNNETDDIVIRTSTKPTGLRYRSVSNPLFDTQSRRGSIQSIKSFKSNSSEGTEPDLQQSACKPAAKTTTTTTTPIATPLLKQTNRKFLLANMPTVYSVDERADADIGPSENNDGNRNSNNNNNNNVLSDNENSSSDDNAGSSNSQVGEGIERYRKVTANLRNRISTKLRTKRLQAITKFRKINKRIRRKMSDTGSDNISYISSDFVRENTPDYIKQSIPRIKVDVDHISADELEGAAKLWIGKDYTNFIVKDFTNLNMPFQDSIDRHTTPRMPWHDISCMVVGAAARDVSRHFIQRWNFTKFSKAKFNDRYPWLIPKTYYDVKDVDIPPFLLRTHRVSCQVLRSVSSWSIGTKRTEASIVDAYIDTITNAEYYVYIENQFFISQTKTHLDDSDIVINRIAEALYRRIMRAFRNDQTFRVYVLIPLLPAFEGEIGTSSGTPIQQISHYNYSTICKGPNSLLEKLSQEIDDVEKYIGFYSLRNYDELNGRLVTELTYVHSKLLIADDRVTIIGSANINDRSMLGLRDSEVCVILEDEEFEVHSMNGRPHKTGRFAGSLRRMLMREHLGLYKKSLADLQLASHDPQEKIRLDSVNDPISDKFWKNIWNDTAKVNTMIYEQVFPVIPTDEIKNFNQIADYLARPKLCKVDKIKAHERLAGIRGHLVYLPLKFLINETNPINSYTAQDHFIPQIIWT